MKWRAAAHVGSSGAEYPPYDNCFRGGHGEGLRFLTAF